MSKSNQPVIIIKRVKKVHGEAHHGGQWKVAYADFVTAMMAFFLLLWLLNATTEEQMSGIANYFSPTAASNSPSGAGGILGGVSMLSPGAMKSSKSEAGVTVSLMPLDASEDPDVDGLPAEKSGEASEEDARELLEKLEQEEFEWAEATLRGAIESIPELRAFSDNLLIDTTAQGMRIPIVDVDEQSMFPSGSSEMLAHTEALLKQVVKAIIPLANSIAVVGHTDSTPYHDENGYTNWELSTDRANASRRALVGAGLPASRIVRVVGKADQEPLVADDPFSPQNRRISIILLRESGLLDES